MYCKDNANERNEQYQKWRSGLRLCLGTKEIGANEYVCVRFEQFLRKRIITEWDICSNFAHEIKKSKEN